MEEFRDNESSGQAGPDAAGRRTAVHPAASAAACAVAAVFFTMVIAAAIRSLWGDAVVELAVAACLLGAGGWASIRLRLLRPPIDLLVLMLAFPLGAAALLAMPR